MRDKGNILQALLAHSELLVALAALIVSCVALYASMKQTSVMTDALTSPDRNRLIEQAMESTFAICDQFGALADHSKVSPTPVDFDALFSKAKQNWRYAAFWLNEDEARRVVIYLLDISSLRADSGFDVAYADYLSAKNESGPKTRTEIFREYSLSCQKSAVDIFAAVMKNPGVTRAIGEFLPLPN